MEVIFLYFLFVHLVLREVPFVILMGKHVLCEIRVFCGYGTLFLGNSVRLCGIRKHYPFSGARGGHKRKRVRACEVEWRLVVCVTRQAGKRKGTSLSYSSTNYYCCKCDATLGRPSSHMLVRGPVIAGISWFYVALGWFEKREFFSPVFTRIGLFYVKFQLPNRNLLWAARIQDYDIIYVTNTCEVYHITVFN